MDEYFNTIFFFSMYPYNFSFLDRFYPCLSRKDKIERIVLKIKDYSWPTQPKETPKRRLKIFIIWRMEILHYKIIKQVSIACSKQDKICLKLWSLFVL